MSNLDFTYNKHFYLLPGKSISSYLRSKAGLLIRSDKYGIECGNLAGNLRSAVKMLLESSRCQGTAGQCPFVDPIFGKPGEIGGHSSQGKKQGILTHKSGKFT